MSFEVSGCGFEAVGRGFEPSTLRLAFDDGDMSARDASAAAAAAAAGVFDVSEFALRAIERIWRENSIEGSLSASERLCNSLQMM